MLAIIALGGVYLNFRLHQNGNKIAEVHGLVNSQLDAVMQKLDDALAQRDTAVGERDEARRDETKRNHE